ncbi:hypothetical protein LDVICp022 [lymphocystis disease virus-China]|uniref:Uncharacterized protein n=2 Tax=Lymphocystis disease virus 2 TaxID=159183 RepID=A0A6F8X0C8_9VIRU|nr:hypothetical protein LDVICp022 [lymphocystis disease virus-China]AAU10870.1 hypothetical protein [lymphocystis disease virus-China]BCB67424.1 hypothetical protein [Lymphocystis disease virus 2]
MCRLCLKYNTFYICVNCVKNSLKTTQGRNLLRRLIIDSIHQLKTKLNFVKSYVPLLKNYNDAVKKLYIELDCYVSVVGYLRYLTSRLDYSTLSVSQCLQIKSIKINWSDVCDTIEGVRRLLTVLIKHCPRILNHAAKDLKEIDDCIYIILSNLKIQFNPLDRSAVVRGDVIKTGCSIIRYCESPWRGKPLPADYQEISEISEWDPFYEDLPTENDI